MLRPIVCLAVLVLAAGASAPVGATEPLVVASIKPIHSLVAGVMEGVGEPVLLVKGAGSEHSYSLRPSEARALAEAEVVFWVGETMETFLIKPLQTLSGDAKVVELSEVPGLTLHATREGGMWEAEEHEHEEEPAGADADHEEGLHQGHGETDMHVWLDPGNAKVLVDAIAATLGAADPANAARYAANAARLRERLDELDRALADRLAAVGDRPYVVFHDAYQYFERRYGTNALGAITINPTRRPGVQRLQEIRARVAQLDAACVFAEPQFEPALVETVIEGTDARQGVLDPLGAAFEAGPGQYFRLMEGLADALLECLEG
jgi:zinc transport system substrate-binding protein